MHIDELEEEKELDEIDPNNRQTITAPLLQDNVEDPEEEKMQEGIDEIFPINLPEIVEENKEEEVGEIDELDEAGIDELMQQAHEDSDESEGEIAR